MPAHAVSAFEEKLREKRKEMWRSSGVDRQWHPTPVLVPGKSHGWRSREGWSPWGRWVGHNWATSLSLFTFMHWRRKWQPTPVFLLEESQGRGSLVGCRLWGHTESDTTEWLSSSRETKNKGFGCLKRWGSPGIPGGHHGIITGANCFFSPQEIWHSSDSSGYL